MIIESLVGTIATSLFKAFFSGPTPGEIVLRLLGVALISSVIGLIIAWIIGTSLLSAATIGALIGGALYGLFIIFDN